MDLWSVANKHAREKIKEHSLYYVCVRMCTNVFVFTVCGMCAHAHTYRGRVCAVTQSPVQCCGFARSVRRARFHSMRTNCSNIVRVCGVYGGH